MYLAKCEKEDYHMRKIIFKAKIKFMEKYLIKVTLKIQRFCCRHIMKQSSFSETGLSLAHQRIPYLL